MADAQETIADIIAEMRKTKYGDAECEVKWCLTQWADRFEAAHQRERGNAAKLREAVKAVVDVGYPHNFQAEAPHIRGYCCDITRAIDKCFAALDTTSNQNTQKEN